MRQWVFRSYRIRGRHKEATSIVYVASCRDYLQIFEVCRLQAPTRGHAGLLRVSELQERGTVLFLKRAEKYPKYIVKIWTWKNANGKHARAELVRAMRRLRCGRSWGYWSHRSWDDTSFFAILVITRLCNSRNQYLWSLAKTSSHSLHWVSKTSLEPGG